jgi:hypothetical protein
MTGRVGGGAHLGKATVSASFYGRRLERMADVVTNTKRWA